MLSRSCWEWPVHSLKFAFQFFLCPTQHACPEEQFRQGVMPGNMAKSEQLVPLYCCEKSFLVSNKGGDCTLYKIIGLVSYVGDAAVFLGIWSWILGFIFQQQQSPIDHRAWCEYKRLVQPVFSGKSMLFLHQILFSWSLLLSCLQYWCECLPSIFRKHGAQVLFKLYTVHMDLCLANLLLSMVVSIQHAFVLSSDGSWDLAICYCCPSSG